MDQKWKRDSFNIVLLNLQMQGSLLQTLVLNDLCKDLNRSVMKDCKEKNLNISQCLKSPGGGSQDMWEILTEKLDKKRGQNLSLQHKISTSHPHKGTTSVGNTQCLIILVDSR